MNGIVRAYAQSVRQGTETSSPSPWPTDNRIFYPQPSTRVAHAHAFPSVRRSTWPLIEHPLNDASKKPLSAALEDWLATGDRIERIRTGGPAIETRVLGITAAVEALIARSPGAHRDSEQAAVGRIARVFDDERGEFAGWRPKVTSWCCPEEKKKRRPVWEQAWRAL